MFSVWDWQGRASVNNGSRWMLVFPGRRPAVRPDQNQKISTRLNYYKRFQGNSEKMYFRNFSPNHSDDRTTRRPAIPLCNQLNIFCAELLAGYR